jgi:ribonuclease BN (tRNA processing enzyme)
VHLTVVGAGPSYSDRPGATGAAYLLTHGERALLLDLGQGSFTRLAGLMDPADLDAVVVSHLHPDHFVDLVPLRLYLRWEPPLGRRVRVVGPAGLADRLDALHAEPGFAAAALDVEVLTEGTVAVGGADGFTVEARHVTHHHPSFGFRVTRADGIGPGLVYSGDCGRAADLEPLIRPGDALLSEVSFGAGPVPHDAQHLDGPAVGELAARTGAGRVLLTHLQMGFDRDATVASVRARYDGPVDLVDPGMRFPLGG